MGVTSHVSDKGMNENRMFIALTLMATFATMASTPAAAEQKKSEPGCISGEKSTSFRAGGLEKSDAICAYDFAEFNRGISRFIEAPAGTFTPENFAAVFGAPPMVVREGLNPNSFYLVNSAHYQILAGEPGWDALIMHFNTRSDSKMGHKDQVTVQFWPSYTAPFKLDDPKSTGCLTQSEIVDRALVAGWRYEIRQMIVEHNSQGLWSYGLLANDDGRTLTVSGLSVEDGLLAPRGKLESTCAIILELAEMRITKNQ